MPKRRLRVFIEKKQYPDFVGYKWHLVIGNEYKEYMVKEECSRITSHVFNSPEEAKKDFFAVRNLLNKITHVE